MKGKIFFLANNEGHMCLEQCEGENFLFWVNWPFKN